MIDWLKDIRKAVLRANSNEALGILDDLISLQAKKIEQCDQIICDLEIEDKHCGDFANMPKREVLEESLLKVAAGYHVGSSAMQILRNHLLIIGPHADIRLTAKGRQYLLTKYSKVG